MRKQHADYLQKYLWGGEFWSDGSTIISVGSRATLEALIPYLKNQGKVAHSLRDANERFMLRSVGCASLLLKLLVQLFSSMGLKMIGVSGLELLY
jgi:hypothetical protein